MNKISFLTLFERTFNFIFIVIILAGLLSWLGVIDPLNSFESIVREDVKKKLLLEARAGDAEAQNKLGTLLYTQAKESNGDFGEGIKWLNEASNQNSPPSP